MLSLVTKTICSQFIGKGLLLHSLNCLNAASSLSPNLSQTFAEWTRAQLCSLYRFSSHCDPARLPAIHMCYFPFVVMACGTWPENIINFRSGLTNNKPAVTQEEVPGRPAVGLSPAVGTLSVLQVLGGIEMMNNQGGKRTKITHGAPHPRRPTPTPAEKERKTREKRNQRKEE